MPKLLLFEGNWWLVERIEGYKTEAAVLGGGKHDSNLVRYMKSIYKPYVGSYNIHSMNVKIRGLNIFRRMKNHSIIWLLDNDVDTCRPR